MSVKVTRRPFFVRRYRRRTLFKALLFIFAVSGAYAWIRSPLHGPWPYIPAGIYQLGLPDPAYRDVETAGFRMQRTEVTVAQFVRFLNNTRPAERYESPQIRYRWGRYRPVVHRNKPVAFVSYAEAEAYAAWKSRHKRGKVRLPTPDEWEIAAQGGTPGIRFPWGWGAPDTRAQFDADGPTRVARFAPNAFGLYDLAGNVAEWCAAEPDATQAVIMGGSWAERHPAPLRLVHRTAIDKSYRDADVGFRLIQVKDF